MNASSLEHKTIRPGSLAGYSYYHSNRQPAGMARAASPGLTAHTKLQLKVFVLVVAAAAALFGLTNIRGVTQAPLSSNNSNKTSKAAPLASASGAVSGVKADPDHCTGNQLDRYVVISVSERQMWACEKSKMVHSAPVITGMLAHASTLTPPGTYKIYAKTTDTTLSGTDETGSWNDPVYYWMPFLDNEHGTYGFHDATWRVETEFGNVDPNSDDASHGCIELPLASSKWLYEWAPVGTTVTVKS